MRVWVSASGTRLQHHIQFSFGAHLVLKLMGTAGLCPLDSSPSNVNVQNAWSYLHALVKSTQFVIIKHRNAFIKSGFKMDEYDFSSTVRHGYFFYKAAILFPLKLAQHCNVMLIVQPIMLLIIQIYTSNAVITLVLAVFIPVTFPLASSKFHQSTQPYEETVATQCTFGKKSYSTVNKAL